MKGRVICLDRTADGREAAALMVDGLLDDLLIDGGDAPRPGTIYRAVVERALKGQGGVTVRLPQGQGFVRRASGLKPGAPVLVQVSGYAEPGKPVPLTDRVIFKSRYVIVTPGAPGVNVSRAITDEARRGALKALVGEVDQGVVLRSVAAGAEDGAIEADLDERLSVVAEVLGTQGADPEMLLDGDSPHVAAWREWTAPADVLTEAGSFETAGVLDQIEAALGPEVQIGETTLFVEPTRALVAVDVNTGGTAGGAAGLKANLAAVKALPRALRLRGLGGQIVVDMAPMGKGHRRQVEQAARAALKTCPVETSLIGWTPLGHLELTRKRERRVLMGERHGLSDL